jgi:hypothetical protein
MICADVLDFANYDKGGVAKGPGYMHIMHIPFENHSYHFIVACT